MQPYYRSSPNNTVRDNFSYKGNVNPYTGAVGTNTYIHDKTSLYYQGPDSHGRVGHNGAPDDPQGYRDPTSVGPNQPQVYSGSNSVSLCPPLHFRMTERDGWKVPVCTHEQASSHCMQPVHLSGMIFRLRVMGIPLFPL